MDELIGIGRTAEVFAYADDRVLKLFYAGFAQEAIDEELKIAAILNAAPELAPNYEGRLNRNGRVGLIYQRVPGITLAQAIVTRPFRLQSHVACLVSAHLGIFTAGPLALPSVKNRLEWALTHNPWLAVPEKEVLLELLARLPEGTAILHGDLHPQNLLVHQGRTAIIDWNNASCGQALADVARTIVILRWGRAPSGSLPPLMATLSLWYTRRMADLYLRWMRKALKFQKDKLTNWLLVVAAARLFELKEGPELSDVRRWVSRQLGKIYA